MRPREIYWVEISLVVEFVRRESFENDEFLSRTIQPFDPGLLDHSLLTAIPWQLDRVRKKLLALRRGPHDPFAAWVKDAGWS